MDGTYDESQTATLVNGEIYQDCISLCHTHMQEDLSQCASPLQIHNNNNNSNGQKEEFLRQKLNELVDSKFKASIPVLCMTFQYFS